MQKFDRLYENYKKLLIQKDQANSNYQNNYDSCVKNSNNYQSNPVQKQVEEKYGNKSYVFNDDN